MTGSVPHYACHTYVGCALKPGSNRNLFPLSKLNSIIGWFAIQRDQTRES
jgi:hypothetical protein